LSTIIANRPAYRIPHLIYSTSSGKMAAAWHTSSSSGASIA